MVCIVIISNKSSRIVENADNHTIYRPRVCYAHKRLEKATGLEAALDGITTKDHFLQVMTGMVKRASANMKNKNEVYTALGIIAKQFKQGAA